MIGDPEGLSQGIMHRLFAIAAFMLALFFVAVPAKTACVDGSNVLPAAVTQGAADVETATNGGHCQHVPCSNTRHSHSAPGGCAGHTFVTAFVFATPFVAVVGNRVEFTRDDSDGRTLLPPVPPPLA